MARSGSRGSTSIGIRPLRRAAERLPDHPLVAALREVGVDLLDPDLPERVDHEVIAGFLARVPEVMGEDLLGLRLVDQLEPTDLDILHYIARASRTLREAVAGRKHMSGRTPRRRLEQEGTTYQDLLNELRVTLARRYLGDRLGVEEVAFLLGYSSPQAFRRAFKRQTGSAPLAFRGRQGYPYEQRIAAAINSPR